jgi:PAS domain S-box-containing protein
VPIDYYNQAIDRVFNSNLPFSYHAKSYDKNLREFYVDVYIEQIIFDNQECVLASYTDITDTKNQAELIKKQRDNYLSMLNTMKLCVIIVNKQRQVIFINETTKIVSGFESEEEFTQVLRNHHLPVEYFNAAIDRVFNSSKPASYQTKSYKKNLEEYFVDVNIAQIIFDGEDCILLSFADITIAKQNEILLKVQRDNYFEIIERLPIGIAIIDENLKYVFVNNCALNISGIPSKALFLEAKIGDYIEEVHLQDALMALDQSKNEPIGPVYFNLYKYDRTIYEAEIYASLFLFEGKNCIQITFTDVSVIKKAEEEKERAKALQLANNKLQREVNDRVIAETQLKNTRNYLRLLIESSRDMIVACDKDGYITEFNNAAQKTFGYLLSEIIGKHFSELYSTKSEYKRIYNVLDYNHSGFSGEIKNKRKNGSEFFASLSATILRNERNEIIGSMGVSRDITRSKEDEILLKDSEERYKAVFNQAFIGIARVDVNTGEFIEVNQHLCNMLGYKKLELLKFTNNQLTLEKDQNINLKVKVIENKKASFSVQKRYLHRDGHIVFINLSYSLVVDDLKRPLYFILVYDDLTDRIKYESEILKQSSRLNAIFNSTSHLIWTLSVDGKLLSYNKNYADFFFELYGIFPSREKDYEQVKGLTNDVKFLKQWEKYFNISLKGHSTNFIARNQDKQGNVIYRDIYINPVFGGNNEIIELAVIAHNITDKVKIQDRLRKNISEKETLLKEIHHRVKNNLQIISSMLSLQSRNLEDESTKKVFLDSQNRVKSMSIIHELLYNTKDFENIDFSKYIKSIISNIQQSYHEANKVINIHYELDPLPLDLDNAIPSGLILNELISNAYKHAFFTLEKGNIFVNVKRKGNDITFSVSDDGVGMSEDFRANKSLGLDLVYSLVGQLNGTMVINNVKGSEFIINYQI